MDGRWILLGFGLLFAMLTVAFVSQGKVFQALIAVVFTTATLGGFLWHTVHDVPVETRLDRFF